MFNPLNWFKKPDVPKEDPIKFYDGSFGANHGLFYLCKQLLDAGMFVDDDRHIFKKYWSNPQEYFKDDMNILIGVAKNDDRIVGVSLLKMNDTFSYYDFDNLGDTIKYGMTMGSLGVYVDEEFRNLRIGSDLIHMMSGVADKHFRDQMEDDQRLVVQMTDWVESKLPEDTMLFSVKTLHGMVIGEKEEA